MKGDAAKASNVPSWRLDAAETGAWDGAHVVVAGIGVSGTAAANALVKRGALVLAVDSGTGPIAQEAAARLQATGVQVRLGDGDTLPEAADVVITSPGFRPDHPLLCAAAAGGRARGH